MADGYVKICTLRQLRARRCIPVKVGDNSIALFYHDGKVNAVHNRCTHSGYPLETGSVKDDVVTCLWHQAKFNLTDGCSVDGEYDDIATYGVEIVDDEIWVSPEPNEVED